MDVISMHFNNLLIKASHDHPQYHFTKSDDFRWSFKEKVIHYDPTHKNAVALLLHELAHAHLDHADFSLDINLIKKESVAWQYAKTILSLKYSLVIADDIVETSLDSYRDWLHLRSRCPDCTSNGLQTKTGTYKCFACGCQWRANTAMHCGLKRYRLS